MTTEYNFPDEIFVSDKNDGGFNYWAHVELSDYKNKYHHDRVVKALQERLLSGIDSVRESYKYAQEMSRGYLKRVEKDRDSWVELCGIQGKKLSEKDAEIAELKKRINDAVLQIAILPGVAELIRKEGIKIETI